MGRTDLADFPDVNDLVDVTLDSRPEPLAAVVSEVSGQAVLLKEPIDRTGRIVIPEEGEGGLLVWGGGSDLRQAPIAVLETYRRPAPSWMVRLTAPAARCQRRSFVRADVVVPVMVRHPEDDFEVTAVDLSEGGMRCNTRSEIPVRRGDTVTLEFSAGVPLTVQASIVRVRRGEQDQPTDLGFSFEGLTMAEADKIRRYVFGQLLEQRRRGAA